MSANSHSSGADDLHGYRYTSDEQHDTDSKGLKDVLSTNQEHDEDDDDKNDGCDQEDQSDAPQDFLEVTD